MSRSQKISIRTKAARSALAGRTLRKRPPRSAMAERPPSSAHARFPVVGIGASAGGLEAFKQLLRKLPVDTGMAFVLLQHLDPKHESLSSEILSRETKIPLHEVQNGICVEANHIYVIPSNAGLKISKGQLHLTPREKDLSQRLLIDTFFQSLAQEQGSLAIGIVLSGTGNDGSEGLIAIKDAGGLTIAQDPTTAQFDGMPRAAIGSGAVDIFLPPEQIAGKLSQLAKHFSTRGENAKAGAKKKLKTQTTVESTEHDSALAQIFELLKRQCHVDFREYKSTTIHRRLERRMTLARSKSIEDYAKFIANKPDEVRLLFDDILIHVTRFFRDSEAFTALKKKAYPILFKKSPNTLRVWVPGCSSGEEAYSIAISLLDYVEEKSLPVQIQIFGSDISTRAIQKARLGEYPESIRQDISPSRLQKYFIQLETGGYRISKKVRDICLFSRHDVAGDPPFAKLDLISCRNLLIYFSPELQEHIIPTFHYSLNPNGILFLGKAEMIGDSAGDFSVVDRGAKIFSKKTSRTIPGLRFRSTAYLAAKTKESLQAPELKTHELKRPIMDLQKEADRAIQAEYPGVLINQDLEILQVRGRTSPYLELGPGAPSHQLMKMARPEIHADLRLAIQDAKKRKVPVIRSGITLKVGRHIQTFNLKVIPIKPTVRSSIFHFILIFETASAKSTKKKNLHSPSRRLLRSDDKIAQYASQLEQELKNAKENQAILTDRFSDIREDAAAANEELQSANEELQSTNEELETAKEELQSGNEELTTVNDELQNRNFELNQANNDLINLLGSVEIPILMLDSNHKIRRFTPEAEKVLHLIPGDLGRPIGDLKLTFSAPGIVLDLDEIVQKVIRTQELIELEVQDRNGHWYRLQARNYRTQDGKTDGAVVALVDVNAFKQSLKEVKAARAEADQANRAKDVFLATLSHELKTPLTTILSWSQLLLSGKLTPEKAKIGAEMIEKSGRAQAQLINDLLDVSRIISGKFFLELANVDLGAILQSTIDLVRPQLEEKAIRIVTHLTPMSQIGVVQADSNRTQQVFTNLMTNAIKFSKPDSAIVITLDRILHKESGKPMARVLVKDSGKGIAPAFIPHMFNRFSQQDSSSVHDHGGLGLGLAIARNLIELQGGSVDAESLGENKGSTFTVLIPIYSDPI